MNNEVNIPLEEDGIEEEILVDEEVAITKAMWGDIGGNIENQTDLQNALDAKQDSLTEAQLNAVNSGITSEKVTTYDGYADQIASKANQSALNSEATTREQADTALGRRIDDEATARQNADNGLQTQIDAITSKSDVVDVVANYAALQAYDTSSLGNNDVIKVLDDETHEDALTYYRWSTTTQTWTYIGQEAPYYSKGQMDVMLQGKQDTLTAGANIQIENGTISATDTTYTAGNGLNLNGTEFSADTDVLATKEDLESYYTKTETDNLLAPKLEAEVVAELPTTGEEGKLYLTPKAHTTQTATGNPITATVAEEAGTIESFQLDGDTFQQTYEGKNLAKTLNGSYSYDLASQTWTLSNGKITASRSNTNYQGGALDITTGNVGQYATATSGDSHLTDNGGTYTFSLSRNGEISGTAGQTARVGCYVYKANSSNTKTNLGIVDLSEVESDSLTINLASDEHIAAIVFYTQFCSYANITFEAQLEAGSTASSFEPFVGGQPSPSPDYPQPMQTVTGTQTVEIQGKNLVYLVPNNGSSNGLSATYDEQTGAIHISGTPTQAWSNIGARTNLSLPAGTYTISATDNQQTHSKSLYAYHPDGTRTQFYIGPTEQFKTVTVSKAIVSYYIYVSQMTIDEAIDDTFYLQLEAGSTVSSFAPYSKQTLPINLGTIELCKLGTYQDCIWKDGEDWKIHKATSKYAFVGTEQWSSGGAGNHCCYTTAITDYATSDNVPYSQYFGGVSNVNGAGTMGGKPDNSIAFIDQSATVRFYLRTTKFENDAPALKAWLSTHNTDVYYALATATDTVITDTTLIAQLEAIRTASLENGTNTITNSTPEPNLAGDMEIGYYGYNPRNRYDKFIWLDLNNNYEQIGS